MSFTSEPKWATRITYEPRKRDNAAIVAFPIRCVFKLVSLIYSSTVTSYDDTKRFMESYIT